LKSSTSSPVPSIAPIDGKYSGLEFEKNQGKASLSLNVTKFFRASRPVQRASRFKASLKILFSCYFEVSNNVFHETRKIYRTATIFKKMPNKTMDILIHNSTDRQTDGKVHLNTILNLLPILQITHLVF
jgi:hypothetical protein